MNGISALIKEVHRAPGPLHHMNKLQEVCNPEKCLHPIMLPNFEFPAFKMIKNKLLLFKSKSVIFCYSSRNRLRYYIRSTTEYAEINFPILIALNITGCKFSFSHMIKLLQVIKWLTKMC